MTQIDGEIYHMDMYQKNQYSENEYTTKSNLQIQCNPYQATNGIFHRTRTNNFTIRIEIQKTSNSQRMELKESTRLTSDYTTKLQSSRQYLLAQRQKYRSMEQNRKPRDKSTNLWTPYL